MGEEGVLVENYDHMETAFAQTRRVSRLAQRAPSPISRSAAPCPVPDMYLTARVAGAAVHKLAGL